MIQNSVIKLIKNKHKLRLNIIHRIICPCLYFLPDDLFLKIRYKLEVGSWLNLKHPKTFNEKLNWLKIHNRKDVFTQMVDKEEVKEYVGKIIGNNYVIPTIGLWNNPKEVDWDNLPNKFVLKTTHGGGGVAVVICKDKSKLDKRSVVKNFEKCMKVDIYKAYREWPYKNVKKRIIAEPLIESLDGDLRDYKFFCFNGKVRCFKIDFGRFTEHHANYYDRDGNLLLFGEKGLEPVYSHIEIMPDNLREMINIAEKLSNNIPFLRVDLYNVSGRIYFGELTFYPAAGMGEFTDKDWENTLGSYINLK